MALPSLSHMLTEQRTYDNKNRTVLNQVRRNKSIVYGSLAIKKHIGSFARTPKDVDVISKNPKRSAKQLQSKLDKQSRGDYYYATPSIFHKGVYKVLHIGPDNKKMTRDDVGVADFSKPKREYKTKVMDGIKYVKLSEIVKDKKKSLADPQFSFRHPKDKEDLRRIRAARHLSTNLFGSKSR